MIIERRKSYRAKEDSIFVLDKAGDNRVYPLEDLSRGGLCFKSKVDIINLPDIKGELRFSNPRLKSVLTIPACVKPIWSKKVRQGFRVGAEFIDISGQDRAFILKRVDKAMDRQRLRARCKEYLLYALLIIATLGGAALFIFQNRAFTSIQDSLNTALSYTEKERSRLKSAFDSTLKEKKALQVELDDAKVLLVQAEGLLDSERMKFNSERETLKKDIAKLKSEVNKLSNWNRALDTRLHDPKELRLAMREIKRETYLKKVKIQKKLDHIKSMTGNKGYITRNGKFTSGAKGTRVLVLPADTRGINNWE
ncbi:MAG: PilZ domain-containing protein [Candidatus Omnitrophota bacterium]